MSRILKEHETSPKHMSFVKAWHELAVRLKRGETIDSEYQKLMQRECDHWNRVLQRIMYIV
ncbi:unnamed protein product [Lymnaea stagnalis]|uniref:Uncharacterized protein n=1 Tax=Lymnaea stagnalis TaxID=6523 RepID=A0AAV2IFV6_LYMST